MSFLKVYVFALLTFGLSIFLGLKFDFYNFSSLVYLALGFFLNRRIGRKLAFHPMRNSIGDVASSKLWSFFFWPIVYFFLLFGMVIDEVL